MAQAKVFIEPKNIIKPKHNTNDDHEQLCKGIVEEVQHLKRQSSRLKDSMKNHEHLIVFVHGFNNDELEMMERGAYLDSKFGTDQVITTAFNWGSYCSVLQYWKDQKSATKCAKYFALYLEEIRKDDLHIFKQVDIVCHSMGNHILVKSILHCYKTKKLHVFEESNIIAIAPDAEKQEYITAANFLANKDAPIVSNWLHFWNRWDGALVTSNIANFNLRAGQSHINIFGKHFESLEWEQDLTAHGYVGNIFDNDYQFKTEVFRALKLKIPAADKNNNQPQKPDADDFKEYDAIDDPELVKFSRSWNDLYKIGVNCGAGNTYWKNLRTYQEYNKTCGTLKLQEDKRKNSYIVGGFRAIGPWSNHTDPYRIIYSRKVFEGKEQKKTKWKEIWHGKNLDDGKSKYDEYKKTIEWKATI